MPAVTTRTELIEYCLRRLGFPVIEINVDDDQIQDRVDDAFDFYMDYHYDGTERVYLAVEVTQADIDNKYITVPDDLIYVKNALPLSNHALSLTSGAMGDPNSSYNVKQLFGMGASSYSGVSSTQDQAGMGSDLPMTTYFLRMQYYSMMSEMFGQNSAVAIRFNRHTNRVYLDMDWSENIEVGQYIVLEGQKSLDPEEFTTVYNDRWIKRYATALIRRQWGANLIKYGGIQLPGGVTLDGDKIHNQAVEELEALEEEMQDKYEEPPMPLMG